jgi:ABC-type nitrate/sulfonate/bicarbonate transport system substrate-binding protein
VRSIGRTKTAFWASLLAALALVGAAAAPQASARARPVPRRAVQHVTLVLILDMLHTADFVAIDKGFFLAHGVDAKVVTVYTGAQASAAMQSGTGQLTDVSVTSVPTARASGLPIITVVPTLNDATTAYADTPLAVVARAGSGIVPGDAKSFVGKRVGLVLGGTGEEYLTSWLVTHGVSPTKVTYVNVQPADQLTAIENGDVDAISTWEPWGTLILDTMGKKARLILRGGPVLGYTLGVGATDSFVRANPKLITNVVAALVEAEWWIRHHLDQAAAIATHFIPGLQLKVAEDSIRNLHFDPRVSRCTIASFAQSTRLLIQQHALKKFIPASQQITARFVRQVEKAYPQYFRGLPPIPPACR